jgi:hypothetical protein
MITTAAYIWVGRPSSNPVVAGTDVKSVSALRGALYLCDVGPSEYKGSQYSHVFRRSGYKHYLFTCPFLHIIGNQRPVSATFNRRMLNFGLGSKADLHVANLWLRACPVK